VAFGTALTHRGLVVGDPVTVLDFGDAPDGVGTPPQDGYPTLDANDGASHVPVGVRLNRRDAEFDGIPTVDAKGDDGDGLDDEDGVVFHTDFLRGLETTLMVQATGGTGFLDAWIDYNRDGDFADAGEQIFTNVVLDGGLEELAFTIPATAATGPTYARFRASSAGNLAPTGEALNGEVEDYAITIAARQPGQKVRCGKTVKGTVKLTVDLHCPEHGLIVGGKDTVINLNGHTIEGEGRGAGILNSEKSGLVVKGRGGSITDFGRGIYYVGGCANRGSVVGVTFDDNSDAGIDVCGKRHVIAENTVSGSAFGILMNGRGYVTRDNTVSGSRFDGIHALTGSTKLTVKRNTVSDSGEDGIELRTAEATVETNEITNSDSDGLIVNNGTDVATIVGSANDTNGDPCSPDRLCMV
jgi:hypothetical protein